MALGVPVGEWSLAQETSRRGRPCIRCRSAKPAAVGASMHRTLTQHAIYIPYAKLTCTTALHCTVDHGAVPMSGHCVSVRVAVNAVLLRGSQGRTHAHWRARSQSVERWKYVAMGSKHSRDKTGQCFLRKNSIGTGYSRWNSATAPGAQERDFAPKRKMAGNTHTVEHVTQNTSAQRSHCRAQSAHTPLVQYEHST
jgi:hypothetical protein